MIEMIKRLFGANVVKGNSCMGWYALEDNRTVEVWHISENRLYLFDDNGEEFIIPITNEIG